MSVQHGYKFTFKHTAENNHLRTHEYVCMLHKSTCSALKKTGGQCGKTCVIGLPMCWVHLRSQMFLRIAPSTIPNAGKGLFAYKPPKEGARSSIVFYPHQTICTYTGEVISKKELIKRYGKSTAPYAVQLDEKGTKYVDGAKYRGVGSLSNQKNARDNNSELEPDSERRPKNILLVASKKINHGDEIFTDYGEDYSFDDGSTFSTKYV